MPDETPPDLLSMFAPSNASEAEAMLRAIQGQQAQQAQQRANLNALLGQQQQQAGGLRSLGLVASLGANPLLQGLRQTAEQQGMGLENAAARTEGRLGAAKAGAMDPLRIIALQQAAERLRQQRAAAEAKAKAEEARRVQRNRQLSIAEQKAAAAPKQAKAPTLPATEVASIADIGVATQALDDLVATHGSLVGGAKGVLGMIPGTDAAKFDDKVNATAQVVGTILEHGKMTDNDLPKYRRMLPDKFDSPERAAAKRDNVKRLLQQQAQQRKKTFGQAGYNVQGIEVPTINLDAPAPSPAQTAPPAQKSIREKRTLADGTEIVIYTDGTAVKRIPKKGP